MWKNVIRAKYGEHVLGDPSINDETVGNISSPWWGDICRLDKGLGWFKHMVRKKLGSGNSTKFWLDTWVGDLPLSTRFPRLFGNSTQQNHLVMEMGETINGVWRWG